MSFGDILGPDRGREDPGESRDLLHFALEVTGLGVWELDIATQAARRTLRHDQVFGYDALLPEWTYARFLQHVHPEDRAAVQERYDHALATGTDWQFECRIRRADGNRAWIEAQGRHFHDASGVPMRIVGTVADITDRKEMETKLRASYEKEHQIARTLQESLLLSPSLEALPGLEVEAFYEPALEETLVGGDFLDSFPLDGGRIALVVGDASGKGLEAAARTVEVKFALRAFLREHTDPARTLFRVNEFLCRKRSRAEGENFVVLTLAVVGSTTGEVVFSVAGAEPPLIVRGGCQAEPIEVGGLPLGIEPGAEYSTVSTRLSPEDTLVLATDGITEAKRRGGPVLGYEGMVEIAQKAVSSTDRRRDPTGYRSGNAGVCRGHVSRRCLPGARPAQVVRIRIYPARMAPWPLCPAQSPRSCRRARSGARTGRRF